MSTQADRPTGRRPSREEVALVELGHTDVSRPVRWFLCLAFLLTISLVPLWQHFRDMRQNLVRWEETPVDERHWRQLLPQVYDIIRLVPDWSQISIRRSWWGALSVLPEADDIKLYERAVEENSVLAELFLPRVQWLLTRYGGTGNEEAVTGRDGWLFYRPDMRGITDAPFLDAKRLRAIQRYTEIEPDPLPALVEFRDDLAARGIELVLMPVPVKPQIHPEYLVPGLTGAPLHNPSYELWLERLQDLGVRIFDPTPLLASLAERGEPTYLATDTHWTPEAMESVAAGLAEYLRREGLVSQGEPGLYVRVPEQVTNEGDIAAMLRLPGDAGLFPPQTVTIQQVLDREGHPWRADPIATILLLGDSFTNIYSAPDLQWGESAGLAQQLSFDLGVPVDSIAINAGGAYSTREELATVLRRHYAEFDAAGQVSGRERLADKRVVIYQFATRELLAGNWKVLPLPVARPEAFGESPTRKAPTEVDAQRVRVTGRIANVSRPPRPNSVPYRDAVIALHLTDVEVQDGDPALAGQIDAEGILVYLMGMEDNRHTGAASLRLDSTVTLEIVPWVTVESRVGSIQRLDLGTDADYLFPVWWAEPSQPPTPAPEPEPEPAPNTPP